MNPLHCDECGKAPAEEGPGGVLCDDCRAALEPEGLDSLEREDIELGLGLIETRIEDVRGGLYERADLPRLERLRTVLAEHLIDRHD
ncbi:MAG: hypothetical protein NUW21_02200 [Elusimicrobia bacterium]|nr:hypothetical protein [Elusimicrobiota bacterium]